MPRRDLGGRLAELGETAAYGRPMAPKAAVSPMSWPDICAFGTANARPRRASWRFRQAHQMTDFLRDIRSKSSVRITIAW